MKLPVFLVNLKPYSFRLLAGVLFCILLISTWFLFYQKPDYPESVHLALQEQLKNIITKTLAEQKPLAHSLQFQSIQTFSAQAKNQIKAEFEYSFFDSENTRISVTGQVRIKRKPPSLEAPYDIWLVDNVETDHTRLDFQKPIILFSEKDKKPQSEPAQ